MHARRVSSHVKRINKRKSERDPPVAVIGNIAAPTVSQSLNQRTFLNSYLPIALENGWITPGAPDFEFNSVIETVGSRVNTYDIKASNVIAVVGIVTDNNISSNNVSISFVLSNGRVIGPHNLTTDPSTAGNIFYVLSPTFLAFAQTNRPLGTTVILDTPINAPITGITVADGNLQGSIYLTTITLIGGGIQPNPNYALFGQSR